jgi:hypothetical protein
MLNLPVTVFDTATSTPAPYCSFKLVDNNPGDAFDGTYALVDDLPLFGLSGIVLQPTDAAGATIFTCDNDNHLLAGDLYAVVSGGSTNSFFNFDDQEGISANGEDLVTCTVDGTGQMTCSANGASVLQYCNYAVDGQGEIAVLSTALDGSSDITCNLVNLAVVPIVC